MNTLRRNRLWTLAVGATLLGAAWHQMPVAFAAGADPQAVQTTLESDKFRTAFVKGIYQKLLGRAATAAESAPLVTQLQGGGTAWVSVMTTIVGSPAYFKKAGNNNTTFVNNMFQDLVGRTPDPTEEAAAAIEYLKGGGTRDQLAGVIADNDAFRLNWTQNYYQQLLGRAPTETEGTEGVAILTTEGVTGLLNIILSSDEYFQRSGGTQNGWQNSVNQALLGNAGGSNAGGGNTGGGNAGGGMGNVPAPDVPPAPPMASNSARAPMVQALLVSPEYHANVVLRYYQRFLDRAPSAAETQQWVGVLQGGGSPDQVMMGVLTSDEYFKHAGGNTTAFLNQLSKDLLGKAGNTAKTGSSGKKGVPSANDLLELLRNLPRNN